MFRCRIEFGLNGDDGRDVCGEIADEAIGKTAAVGDNVFSDSAIVFRNGPSQSYTWQSNTQSTAGDSSVSASNAGMAARKLRSGMVSGQG